MKKISCVLMFLVLSCVGCNNDDKGDNFPNSATEVKVAYEKTPDFLENYFWEIEKYGESANSNTVAIYDDETNSLAIYYQGEEIYNETHGWGIYMYHGFLRDNTYIIFLQEYDPGHYSGTSKIFINGELTSIPISNQINGIREYGNGWIIIISQVGSIRTSEIKIFWSMYNVKTGEVIEFGECGEL